jgi:hypothetical protein
MAINPSVNSLLPILDDYLANAVLSPEESNNIINFIQWLQDAYPDVISVEFDTLPIMADRQYISLSIPNIQQPFSLSPQPSSVDIQQQKQRQQQKQQQKPKEQEQSPTYQRLQTLPRPPSMQSSSSGSRQPELKQGRRYSLI